MTEGITQCIEITWTYNNILSSEALGSVNNNIDGNDR